MSYSLFGSATTVVMLVVFVGIMLWAWSGKRRAAFEEAARVPLEDDLDAGAHIDETRAAKDDS